MHNLYERDCVFEIYLSYMYIVVNRLYMALTCICVYVSYGLINHIHMWLILYPVITKCTSFRQYMNIIWQRSSWFVLKARWHERAVFRCVLMTSHSSLQHHLMLLNLPPSISRAWPLSAVQLSPVACGASSH